MNFNSKVTNNNYIQLNIIDNVRKKMNKSFNGEK